jgi:enoyl-CoA hydratase/carnithine racemase
MSYSTIQFAVTRGVATLRLNRPERMNAIDAVMYDELSDAIGRAENDPAVRVVRLAAVGDRAFCAGADLAARGSERAQDPTRVLRNHVHPERALTPVLLELSKPVVAAVNGVAAGGGLALALSADILVASTGARFGTAHVRLAMPLLDMLGYLLPRRVGPGAAAQLAYTGRIIEADEALAMHLADRVVEPEQLEQVTTELAEEIARQAPLALRFTKQALRRFGGESVRDYLPFERYVFATCLQTEDAKEAVRAMRDKRGPEFKGA